METYPTITIDNAGSSRLDLVVTAKNTQSQQSINFQIVTSGNGSTTSKPIIVLIFGGILIFSIAFLKIFFRFCCLTRDEEESMFEDNISRIKFSPSRSPDSMPSIRDIQSMKKVGYSALINESEDYKTTSRECSMQLIESEESLVHDT